MSQRNQQVDVRRPIVDSRRGISLELLCFQQVYLQQPQVAVQHPFWGDVSSFSRCEAAFLKTKPNPTRPVVHRPTIRHPAQMETWLFATSAIELDYFFASSKFFLWKSPDRPERDRMHLRTISKSFVRSFVRNHLQPSSGREDQNKKDGPPAEVVPSKVAHASPFLAEAGHQPEPRRIGIRFRM